MNSNFPAGRTTRRPPHSRIGFVRPAVASLVHLQALWLLLLATSSHAQWLTQTVNLTAGWNAVYVHLDPSHTTLTDLVGADPANPILEIWQWRPASSTMQFTQNPQAPSDSGSQWACWVRTSPQNSTLSHLAGNAAYLVRLPAGAPSYSWRVKGVPLAPMHTWTTTGLNFVGFPTPATTPPTFEQFFSPAAGLQQNAEVYRYIGGDLGAANPARVFAFRTVPVVRGQAFWIRAGGMYNRYFGPFEVVVSGSGGTMFGATRTVCSLRLRNLTAGGLTVSLNLLPSESAPAGQPYVNGAPPLLVRGNLDPLTFVYPGQSLGTGQSRSWTLAPQGQPGSDVEVVLGINRSSMTGSPGVLFAAALRFTDSLGLSQIDLPVSATVASSSGLWVGKAMVSQVGAYLKQYARDANDEPVTSPQGSYVVTHVKTNLGAVARLFPLQLVVHNPDPSQPALLLQRVYLGVDAGTNMIAATRETALHPGHLDMARRISVTHLPWTSDNKGWEFNGNLATSSALTATVHLDYNDHASNPFLHTYHPDHDNRDATFRNVVPQGAESYSVQREVTLRVVPPSSDFASLTSTGQNLNGEYAETITILGLARDGGMTDSRQFRVQGVFHLTRLLDAPTLTTSP
jgi:hypothetical protein